MNKSLLFFLAAIGWLIISIILLTIPGTAFPTEDWFDKIWLDKWIHIGMFALMVVLWCLAWRSIKTASQGKLRQAFITIAVVFTAYGIIMEFVQLFFVAHRSFDIGDIIADGAGCAAGAFFSIRRYIKR